MISKRTIITLIIIVVVVIGLAIAILLTGEDFFSSLTKENTNQEISNLNQATLTNQNLPPTQSADQPALTPVEQALTTVARNFAERFGSFSTDAKYANLEEAKLLASARLANQLEITIKGGSASAEFYGISSKVLKVKINYLNETEGDAQVTVTLQREETKTDLSQLVFYQDLDLTLISSGSSWLVDSYEWEVLE